LILDEIVAHRKAQVELEKAERPVGELLPLLERTAARDFKGALDRGRMSVIAEIKRASPSKGIISASFSPEEAARAYEVADADAVSVLTERKYFLGDDSYLEQARCAVSMPVLRKDFIVDEYQLYQSKAMGADAVLLIASVLGKELKRFSDLAAELGLGVLAEVHDYMEMYSALNAGCSVIGINNRDLRTFEVDLGNTERLVRHIPRGVVKVSESGIRTAEDVRYLRSLGVDAVLIGETLMRKLDEPAAIAEFIERSRG
jgi:indole-3-glycerol phosphate synthase